VKFYTKWIIHSDSFFSQNRLIKCTQKVEMQGSSDQIINNFTFWDFESIKFKIELENELVGKIFGTGVIDKKTIAWEFRGHSDFDGFEAYELLENGDYFLHAEYSSTKPFRTTIDGRIWKKGNG
jgi:hypothetical protein